MAQKRPECWRSTNNNKEISAAATTKSPAPPYVTHPHCACGHHKGEDERIKMAKNTHACFHDDPDSRHVCPRHQMARTYIQAGTKDLRVKRPRGRESSPYPPNKTALGRFLSFRLSFLCCLEALLRENHWFWCLSPKRVHCKAARSEQSFCARRDRGGEGGGGGGDWGWLLRQVGGKNTRVDGRRRRRRRRRRSHRHRLQRKRGSALRTDGGMGGRAPTCVVVGMDWMVLLPAQRRRSVGCCPGRLRFSVAGGGHCTHPPTPVRGMEGIKPAPAPSLPHQFSKFPLGTHRNTSYPPHSHQVSIPLFNRSILFFLQRKNPPPQKMAVR